MGALVVFSNQLQQMGITMTRDEIIKEAEVLKNEDSASHIELMASEPYAYAVVNDQGYFVGIWSDEQIAIDICNKGQPSHHQKVVPVYAHPAICPHCNKAPHWREHPE